MRQSAFNLLQFYSSNHLIQFPPLGTSFARVTLCHSEFNNVSYVIFDEFLTYCVPDALHCGN